jgi:O-antigen ligase
MNDEAARRFMDVLIYMGGLWAALSIFMFILDPDGVYGYQKIAAGRLTGALSSANSAGTLFGALSVISFARLLSRFWHSRSRSLLEKIDMAHLMVFLASMAALFMSLSRMGILATLICLILVSVILSWKRLPLRSLLIGSVASGLVLIVLFSVPLQSVLTRFEDIGTDAAVREVIFKAHYEIAVKQFWFGFGLGSFNPINETLVSAANYPDLSILGAAHNVYLQWFEETGIVGLLALGLLNLSILIPIIRSALDRKMVRDRLWAILAAYCVFLIHGTTDYAFQEPALTVFLAVWMGLGLAMATNSNRVISS